ncbi:MAG: hypothetical protein NTAFB01_19200 [Nitrospira sp.]
MWAGNLTYIRTTEGRLYLAVLLDLCLRTVIDGRWDAADAGADAASLQMTLHRHQLKLGLLHHSDRGSQYAATTYP